MFDKLFSIYQILFKEQSDALLNKLLNNAFIIDDNEDGLISINLLTLLSERYISTSHIEMLIDIFSELFEDSSSEIDSENYERYYLLLSHLSHDNYQNEKFRKHISNMYEALESAVNDDYDDFIDGIFDTISPFFNIIKTTELDSLLSCITEYFTEDTEKTEKLYKLMNGCWPTEDSTNLPNYSIENIAKNTLELIKKTDCSIDKKLIFESVYSVYKDKKCSLPNFKEHITHSLMYLWKEHTEYAYNELLKFKDIMLKHFYYEWLGPRTPKEYNNLLESYWKEIFKIANNEELKKRTKHYITEYKNNTNKDLWFDLLYQRLGNIDIISEVSTELIIGLNANFIEQCKFISNYIQNKYDNKIKNIYTKALFHGYISIQDVNYKKEILEIMKNLLDKEAKGFFSKSDFKNALDVKKDVDKMYKAFKKNKSLLMYRKELFSRKKKVQKQQ